MIKGLGRGGSRRGSGVPNHFSMVPVADIERSSFNRSHGIKTAFDSGYLVPIFADEVLPGDTFNMRHTLFARLSTPVKPILDNLYLETFYFYVPLRLLWTNFKKFMGEQANPADSISYLCPTIQSPASGSAVGSLSDYLGMPTVGQVTAGKKLTCVSFWHRAYNLIWNEWFRDENLQNSVTVDTGDGPDTDANYVLLRRGKRHDYFTSALPWTQKNAAGAVTIPLGTTAPVQGTAGMKLYDWTVGAGASVDTLKYNTGPSRLNISTGTSWADTNDAGLPPVGTASNVYADLSTASAATINSLRQAFQLQRMYERDARGGSRYTEIVRSHFRVVSPDARLQRPEYLGGGSSPISVTPIPQTAATGVTGTAQGNLAAVGVGVQSGVGFNKSFTEHGVLIGLANVRADLNYQQGINRMFSRSTRADFFWPALAHLGEQSILNKEIYAVDDSAAQDSNVFGYQERYAEYRYKPSLITGKLRSTASGTLDIWHLAQKFTSLPTLGSTFIVDTPPIDRIQAVNTEPQIYLDGAFKLICARPMPVYSVPGLIDHF